MPDAIGFHCHERAVCIQTMLAQAQEHSAAAGLRLSPVRRRTLEVLLAEHRALGFFGLAPHGLFRKCHQPRGNPWRGARAND